jgi:3-phosphoshikimate 1-carboxyvinyltransferase
LTRIQITNPLLTLSVAAPGSKSISNRLLMLQRTSGIPVRIANLSTAADATLLSNLLTRIDETSPSSFSTPTVLCCNNCGTAYRFLTAYLSCQPGLWTLDGNENMRRRPVEALVNALVAGGAEIKYLQRLGFPPLRINGKQLTTTSWQIDSKQSSQYVSAIALLLPLLRRSSVIRFSPDSGSLQYVDMTIRLMQQAGIAIDRKNNVINYLFEAGAKAPVSFFVEYDWSAAAIWFVLAALSSRADIFIAGLKPSHLQADSIIAQWVKAFGVETIYGENGVRVVKTKPIIPSSLHLDCKNNLDLVPYLATLCAGLRVKAELKNVENLSIKESNRLDALVRELGKISVVRYKDKVLRVEPDSVPFPSTVYFSSHDDHRIAMSLSLLSLCVANVYMDNPGCVAKSYPEYWENLTK